VARLIMMTICSGRARLRGKLSGGAIEGTGTKTIQRMGDGEYNETGIFSLLMMMMNVDDNAANEVSMCVLY